MSTAYIVTLAILGMTTGAAAASCAWLRAELRRLRALESPRWLTPEVRIEFCSTIVSQGKVRRLFRAAVAAASLSFAAMLAAMFAGALS